MLKIGALIVALTIAGSAFAIEPPTLGTSTPLPGQPKPPAAPPHSRGADAIQSDVKAGGDPAGGGAAANAPGDPCDTESGPQMVFRGVKLAELLCEDATALQSIQQLIIAQVADQKRINILQAALKRARADLAAKQAPEPTPAPTPTPSP